MSSPVRLFCCGEGISFRYGMYGSKALASQNFGSVARTPDSDDMRRIWQENKLSEKTSEDIQALFGISRQALSLWRQKAGADILTYRDFNRERQLDLARAVFDATKTAQEMADEAGIPAQIVRELAAGQGVKLPNRKLRRPPDAEIVKLAEGRTWKQLAKVCNVSVFTIQHYVYARPALAAKVKKALVSEPTGARANGRITDVDALVADYRSGMSTYKVAEKFDVQPMTVIYWLRKLGVYEGARKTA